MTWGYPMRRPPSLPDAVMTEIQRYLHRTRPEGRRSASLRAGAGEATSVGRSSLREAMQGLQAMGLVVVRHGVGTFFASEPGKWLLSPNKILRHAASAALRRADRGPTARRGAARGSGGRARHARGPRTGSAKRPLKRAHRTSWRICRAGPGVPSRRCRGRPPQRCCPRC